jgi:hypothetical protein
MPKAASTRSITLSACHADQVVTEAAHVAHQEALGVEQVRRSEGSSAKR